MSRAMHSLGTGGCASNSVGPIGAWVGRLLHWEKQSTRCRQYACAALREWTWGRTLGGMRVERPRFWTKLILTAGAQLAPIALVADCPLAGLRTWAGKTMRRDGVDGEVAQGAATASFCRRR
jgi:hypothetical protein